MNAQQIKVKHAFQKKAGGLIRINFKKEKEGLSLMVEDNGKGMEKLPENPTQIKTFGLKLIHLLVEKLKANWEISGLKGTCVSIQVQFQL